LNPEYVENTKHRLNQEFTGFDSVDERMSRIPNDLNDDEIRDEYLSNHEEWFLKNHPDAIEEFKKESVRKYGHKIKKPKKIKEDRAQRTLII
jgi:site-specific DNA-methyltransferase (adenine-specific)